MQGVEGEMGIMLEATQEDLIAKEAAKKIRAHVNVF
jgi:hypothetical protein